MAFVVTGGNVRATATSSGINPANLDPTCKPCTDFYQFANGGWIKNHPLPAAFPSYGAFTVLALHNRDVLHGILGSAAASQATPGSNEQKIGDFYAACMNEAAIEHAGIAPLNEQLALVDRVTDPKSVAPVLAQLHHDGTAAFFTFGAGPDFKNSSMTIGQLGQGGLGLPNRDYYLNTDAKSQQTRTAYLAHVAQMFGLLGESPDAAAADAKTVMAMETTLAQASLSPADRRDPTKTYHKMTRAQLQALGARFDWGAYFAEAVAAPVVVTDVNVAAPDFVSVFSTNLALWTPAEIRTYLRWHVVHAYAAALPKAFADANFDFYARTLQGTKEQLPRWQRCTAAVDQNLGEALGQVYVAKTFSAADKAQALAMVHTIKATLRDDFASLSWMSQVTRDKAIAKLDAFLLKIGYPDKWRDYRKLSITRDSYLENLIASSRFENERRLARIGQPPDRAEWGMTPPTVNAYYNPTVNEIVFPAGILQPPFYNPGADPAVNFGGIGAVIGHESTHGFDNSGRNFDGSGNLTDWWTDSDASQFNAKAQCVVNQFDALEPVPGVHENGKLVQGEAIADLGGLTIAYKAFEKWQSAHPRRTLDGYTPEQRFFIGFASVWASTSSDEFKRFLAQTNEHPYDTFRVNATLSNMPQFAQAWFCKLNDPMVRPPDQRCQIW